MCVRGSAIRTHVCTTWCAMAVVGMGSAWSGGRNGRSNRRAQVCVMWWLGVVAGIALGAFLCFGLELSWKWLQRKIWTGDE